MKTEDSFKAMEVHVARRDRLRVVMEKFKTQLEGMALDALETLSEKMSVSHYSATSGSNASSVLMQKRMKANAQKARLQYSKKEAALEKQRAVLEIDLKLINEMKETAAAEAEVDVLEAVEPNSRELPALDVLQDVKMERTAEFINACSSTHSDKIDEPLQRSRSVPASATQQNSVHQFENLNVPPFQQLPSVVGEISNFLIRKDMMLSRFYSFDDSPSNYASWKAGFSSLIQDLHSSPTEELDLLTKWLGPESRKFAMSIRTANVNNPEKGLHYVWQRLEERYGRPEMFEADLKAKLRNIPKLADNDPKRLYDLLDIITEIESAKQNEQYSVLLSYFDSSSGVLPIVSKLPHGLQERWATQASRYKKDHHVAHPPFWFFVNFVRDMCTMKNDPGLYPEDSKTQTDRTKRSPPTRVLARKSTVSPSVAETVRCPIHKASHSLENCRVFENMSLHERRAFVKDKDLCFRCGSGKHRASSCKAEVKCAKCSSARHITLLHVDREAKSVDGGERSTVVTSNCTQLCGRTSGGRSCGKIVLVRVFPVGCPSRALRVYAIIDDQSNQTLAKSKFFELFEQNGEHKTYTLSSCSGSITYSGRTACNFVIEPVDGGVQLSLPNIVECDEIPNSRQEIPTPDVARAYPHLVEIADKIPPLDRDSEILLLIGRDMIKSHHVLDQRIGPLEAPYAQRLHLGWVIIGEVCLGLAHKPKRVVVNKTFLLPDGRESICEPCNARIRVSAPIEKSRLKPQNVALSQCDIFQTTPDDDKPGLSIEVREFLALMDKEFYRGDNGRWTAPLPFRSYRPRLPNNRSQVLKRAIVLDTSLKRNPTKKQHAIDFMSKVFANLHAEPAPPLEADEECWYLPIFSVYHPHKPNKVRMVFDSSAKFRDVSLNSVLFSGPDLTNSLLGVLMRFRLERVAVTADIEQMFHCFEVSLKHRNYLRFLWYTDNDPGKELSEFRMCVHVFGNSPSPAVATYGMRRAALDAETSLGSDISSFVERNFYVDDGLTSLPTSTEAIDLLQRTQKALWTYGNLRLHKIASNDETVMRSFSSEDLAKDLVNLDLGSETLPLQRSLGLYWNLENDCFTYRISLNEKPYTRRGVLSCVNSLYDPLGFIAPVTIQGKLLLRAMMADSSEWDEPLPIQYLDRWIQWQESLLHLENCIVPRQYLSGGPGEGQKRVVVFTDASENAIAAVAYLCGEDSNGMFHIGFVLGKAKVAPKQAVSIPRLELCAAVLGVEIAEIIKDQLDISREQFQFFTDSKVVLGYIHNQKRRFFTYVSNRVQRIRRFSSIVNWNYVPTEHNPADCGTKQVSASKTGEDPWLQGPREWLCSRDINMDIKNTFDLVDSASDKEIRPEIIANKLAVNKSSIGTHRFSRFSEWNSLISAFQCLRRACLIRKGRTDTERLEDNLQLLQSTELFVIRQVQQEVYCREIDSLRNGKPIPKDSKILSLDPILDEHEILCVGGRLKRANFKLGEKNPILIPGDHHIAKLLVQHHHMLIRHQGRHFTEGAVRSSGYWITGCKRLVYSIISKCVKCRRLRGSVMSQKMADLPVERLTPCPPFTYVGVDCFGPWNVVTRRTRGGSSDSKRWAVLFSCLSCRAVHIELIEEMSTSSFINALRRFYAIRGRVKEFYSDRGTNFVGAVHELDIPCVNVENPTVMEVLSDNGTIWKFNTPHSSHMGGAWERLIGVFRRILDSYLVRLQTCEAHT